MTATLRHWTDDALRIAGMVGETVDVHGRDQNGAAVLARGELYSFRMRAGRGWIDQTAKVDTMDAGPVTVYGSSASPIFVAVD